MTHAEDPLATGSGLGTIGAPSDGPHQKRPDQMAWWRWFELVAAGTAIVGLVAALLALAIDGPATQLPLIIWVILVATSGPFVFYFQQKQHSQQNLKQRRKYSRAARYASAMSPLHQAFHQMRDAAYLINEARTPEDYYPVIIISVTRLAEAFSLASLTPCRVTVKELLKDGNPVVGPISEEDLRTYYVEDRFRSQTSHHVPGGRSTRDWVTDNTDFESILFHLEDCFFANDLTVLSNYKNSHWTSETVRAGSYDYVATIVLPIRKTRMVDAGNRHDDLLGFLCIDSKTKECFHDQYDFEMGAAYADAFYILMRLLISSRKNEEQTGGARHEPS